MVQTQPIPVDFVTASQTVAPSVAWNAADCDGDGVTNGDEVADGTDPNDPVILTASQIVTPSAAWETLDCDGDLAWPTAMKLLMERILKTLVILIQQVKLQTLPQHGRLDCDGDGVTNGDEIADGTDPKMNVT